MAKITVTEQRQDPTPPPLEGVELHLTLSVDEAQRLKDFCGKIGGDFGGVRKVTGRIYDGLSRVTELSERKYEYGVNPNVRDAVYITERDYAGGQYVG